MGFLDRKLLRRVYSDLHRFDDGEERARPESKRAGVGGIRYSEARDGLGEACLKGEVRRP